MTGKRRIWRFRIGDKTVLEVSAPADATRTQIRRRGRWSIVVGMLLAILAVGAVMAYGSSVDEAIVDAIAPNGSVTLAPGASGPITINLTVTGKQDGTATFDVYRNWTLSGGTFVGSNPQTFTVNPQAAGTTTSFSTTGTVSVDSGQAAGTFTLAVGAFNITNSNSTGAKLNAGSSSSYVVTVMPPSDTTPPDTSITAQPDNPTNSTSASFSFTGTDNVTASASLTYECSLDGAAFSTCTSGQSYNSLAEGSHTFQVRAKDAANNVDPTPASYTWTVDTTAPSVSAPDLAASSDSGSSDTDNKTNATNLVFNGTAEAGATVKLYRDSTLVDSATATGGSWSITDSNPAEGTYSYTATATDAAGNTSSPSTGLSVLVDRTPPDVQCGSADGVWHAADVSISCTASDTGGSGLANSGDATFSLSTTVPSGTETSNAFTGSKTVYDVAGNSAVGGPITGNKVDKKAPVISDNGTSDSPSGNDGTNDWYKDNVTVNFSATDSGSGVACTSPWTQTTTGEGTNVTVSSGNCADNVGNSGNAITSSGYHVDKTKPVVSVTGPSNGATYTLGSVPTAGCTTTDALSGVKTYASVSTSGGPVGSVTVTCGGAEDYAGNTNGASITFTVKYGLCLLYDTTKSFKAGSTAPLKLYLCDASGADVSDSAIVVHAASLKKSDNSPDATVTDSGNANPDNDFRYGSTLGPSGGYIFNLSTKYPSPALGQTSALSSGTWNLSLTIDGVSGYSIHFDVK